MMRKHLFILAAIASFLLIFLSSAQAMSVTASPNPANVNQNVGITVTATFSALIGTNCNLQVNYGDSGSWTPLPLCTTTTCIRNTSHVYTSAGSYTITAQPIIGACVPPPNAPTTATTSITILCPALSISSPATLPQATAGTSYTYQIQVSGGTMPYSHAIIAGALPPGLIMNSSGFISGTPTTQGTYNFTVRVSDNCPSGSQTAQRSFSITVAGAPCALLSITSSGLLPPGTAGQLYSYQVQTSGGVAPVSFNLVSGSLPAGLNLNPAGLLSGIPNGAGSYTFTIAASDSCSLGIQTVQRTFLLDIDPAACPVLTVTSSPMLPQGTEGQPYSYQVQTSGGVAPVSFSLAFGTLPPGLTLNPAGLISGLPTTAGTYSFTVTAADSCSAGSQQAQGSFTLVINPASIAGVQVTPVPSLFSIPRNTAWTQNISYLFTGPAGVPLILDSDKGVFRANNTVIGEANLPLSVSIVNGSGNTAEVLNIPVAISERAEALGTNRIMYSREFTDGLASLTAEVAITVTTGAMAEFRITRMQLYFENKRGEITVPRNQPSLKAFVDINYTGSGLLKGYWEVDSRILSHVNQHLVFGKSITLSSPDVPALPTFAPGTHIVRFIITSMLGELAMPEGIYFVSADEAGEAYIIGLVMPEDSGQIGYGPYTFGWRREPWANTYLVEFFGEDTEKPIFTAYTRKSTYLLPPAILKKVFAADTSYQWRVKGYDAEGKIIGQSRLNAFNFSQ